MFFSMEFHCILFFNGITMEFERLEQLMYIWLSICLSSLKFLGVHVKALDLYLALHRGS